MRLKILLERGNSSEPRKKFTKNCNCRDKELIVSLISTNTYRYPTVKCSLIVEIPFVIFQWYLLKMKKTRVLLVSGSGSKGYEGYQLFGIKFYYLNLIITHYFKYYNPLFYLNFESAVKTNNLKRRIQWLWEDKTLLITD